ncbi:hypothetical protein MPTK1_8g01760 [Marchantia polymorpha subsp. ruderalis]|uniref:CCDC113/CCDC96 coiled-coil domain-containing protein n=1 Tax=Marchantia polymorpha TaxID=3197 RepID=A0A2R6WR49_MARPO|nr:hypothetical protein MARPO_0064s0024 [Marchantia polymorpha]BBN18338.1 hypothetical protein Mp_8g01760 [Marchantia polymorpha subsp. ruderalis]|eukprot:PTQ36335.1 hypothetical protein MARPO_0064s0024 [Marchantia polymorpha]
MFCWLHCWLYIVIFRLLFVHLCKHPQYEVYDFHFGLQNLAKWLLLKEELKQIRQHYRDEIDRQHDLLQKTQIEAREAQENFLSDLLKVAREAQHSVSGQILSEVVLNQLQERNKHATLEMEKCRIVQRQLLAHLHKLEQARKKKDQLPEGLHLVDYEQLKMENESLAEKIHAKNEEIVIMRKKRTSTVHALSHVREKLQFVEKDTKIVSDRLDEVEKGLHQGRIDLHNLKSRCEHISQKKSRLQKSMVNISDPLLLDDLENLKDDAEATEEIILDLRQRYDAIHKDLKTKTKYVNSKKKAQLKTSAAAAAEADGDTDSTVTNKHKLRWGEERSVGRKLR